MSAPPQDHDLNILKARLALLDADRARLIAEIERAQATQPVAQAQVTKLGASRRLSPPQTSEEKIALFLDLFRCRQSVFPRRWENRKTGKQGYSPACMNEWKNGVCEKPKVKCAECKFQSFRPLDEAAAEAHLKGRETIGTYAIREDDSTVFISCDFDGKGWQKDIAAYQLSARALGIEVSIERSRSGNGGHAWIFFSEPVSAREARLLGTFILSKSEEERPEIGSSTYDRFFPNQDSLPKGGFGNLIALPLQREPRERGNSAFLDENFRPFEDQWAHLGSVRRLSAQDLREILRLHVYSKKNNIPSSTAIADFSQEADEAVVNASVEQGQLLLGISIDVTLSSQIEIPIQALPAKIITQLKRTASFANPEFYKLQRMRMPTYPNPRFIFSGELQPDRLFLPRGCLDKVRKIFKVAGAEVVIRDERLRKKRLKVAFSGELKPDQEAALVAISRNDYGILSAPPGAGKTVMGCALIAKRQVSTLILVHRQPILDQWKERLQQFLNLGEVEIGTWGGGSRKKPSGRLDLAMLPTLTRKEDLSEIAESYSQIIVDEAHHIPAASFEAVMKQLPARYVVGLTATPYRKDGLEKILFQQCGPIQHTIESTDGGLLQKTVNFKETGFRLPEDLGPKPAYHAVLHGLVTNADRNLLIARDAAAVIRASRFPLLISDRKDHLDLLCEAIKKEFAGSLEVIRMEGGMGKKERARAKDLAMSARQNRFPTLLIATASLIGEGFDLPDLDTLILATPLSFKGRMVQYAGRLHRLVDGKDNVLVHDYVDSSVAMLLSMYRKRIQAYQSMGYTVDEPKNLWGPRSSRQMPLLHMNQPRR